MDELTEQKIIKLACLINYYNVMEQQLKNYIEEIRQIHDQVIGKICSLQTELETEKTNQLLQSYMVLQHLV